jgi:hypothetical protein
MAAQEGQSNLDALRDFAAKAAAKLPSRRGSLVTEPWPSKSSSRRTSAQAAEIDAYLSAPQTAPVFDGAAFRFAKRSSFISGGGSPASPAAAAGSTQRPTLLQRRGAQLAVSKLIIADKRGTKVAGAAGAARTETVAGDAARGAIAAQPPALGISTGQNPNLVLAGPSLAMSPIVEVSEGPGDDVTRAGEVRIDIASDEPPPQRPRQHATTDGRGGGGAHWQRAPAGTCGVCRQHELPLLRPSSPARRGEQTACAAKYRALCGWCEEDTMELLNTKKGRGRWEICVQAGRSSTCSKCGVLSPERGDGGETCISCSSAGLENKAWVALIVKRLPDLQGNAESEAGLHGGIVDGAVHAPAPASSGSGAAASLAEELRVLKDTCLRLREELALCQCKQTQKDTAQGPR